MASSTGAIAVNQELLAASPMASRRINLKSWSIFALLDKEFLSKIKLACVFGNLGNEALVITFDDEVYAIGSNGEGCHGVGDMNSSLKPRKLESLCQRNITDLAYGSGPHVLALTKLGEVFSVCTFEIFLH